MAQYQAGPGSYYANKRLYRPGETVELPDSTRPPKHLVPVDQKAKEIYAAWHPNVATPKHVPQKPPEQTVLSPKEYQDKYEKQPKKS